MNNYKQNNSRNSRRCGEPGQRHLGFPHQLVKTWAEPVLVTRATQRLVHLRATTKSKLLSVYLFARIYHGYSITANTRSVSYTV